MTKEEVLGKQYFLRLSDDTVIEGYINNVDSISEARVNFDIVGSRFITNDNYKYKVVNSPSVKIIKFSVKFDNITSFSREDILKLIITVKSNPYIEDAHLNDYTSYIWKDDRYTLEEEADQLNLTPIFDINLTCLIPIWYIEDIVMGG